MKKQPAVWKKTAGCCDNPQNRDKIAAGDTVNVTRKEGKPAKR
jgi:hypothetical protein